MNEFSHVVCAVRDSKMDAYMQPFFVKSIGVAARSFADEVNRKESPMFAHPEDYELFHIANFNEDTGIISSLPNPKSIGVASTFFAPRE